MTAKLTLLSLLALMSSCQFVENLNERAEVVNRYEKKALFLAKENREMRAEISRLEYQLDSLEAKNQFLEIQLEKIKEEKGEGTPSRSLASISVVFDVNNDLVKQSVYQWSDTQLLSIGQQEFQRKNYEKSAQFFQTYLLREEDHKTVDDQILFQSGMAAYESGKYYHEAVKDFQRLVENYPTSKFYRSAKLWGGLSYFKLGETKKFYNVVDEFRQKYKNTPEWKILREYYEDITQKYKEKI
jgi:TolA-binding protein